MTTVSKYQATITYKSSFSIEGSSDRKIHVGTKSQFQQMFSGSSTEEFLYIIRDYENKAKDLGIRLPAYIKILLALLNAGLRATVKNIIQDQVQGKILDIAEDLTAIPPVLAQTEWDQFKK